MKQDMITSCWALVNRSRRHTVSTVTMAVRKWLWLNCRDMACPAYQVAS
jgi:hypothetical protein